MEPQEATSGAPRAKGMPMLGLGTWQNDAPEQCTKSVQTALEMGYRHVDTAQAYGNEAAVGEGIRRADVPREEVFIATKVWIDSLGFDDVIATAQESLERLGVASVDLLYVHWPARTYDPENTLAAFDELRDRGLIEHVGVSNFEPPHLDKAREVLDAPLYAIQVELHPLLQQEHLRAYCADASSQLVAYSPLARGKVFDIPELQEIAERHDVSEPQVALAWLREVDVAAIPKATSEEHLRDNWGSLGVNLDDEEVAKIKSIDREDRQVHPSFAPDSW